MGLTDIRVNVHWVLLENIVKLILMSVQQIHVQMEVSKKYLNEFDLVRFC